MHVARQTTLQPATGSSIPRHIGTLLEVSGLLANKATAKHRRHHTNLCTGFLFLWPRICQPVPGHFHCLARFTPPRTQTPLTPASVATYTIAALAVSSVRRRPTLLPHLDENMPWAFIIGLVSAALLTPVAIVLARRFDLYDKPAKDNFHNVATPLLGGLGILAGITIATYILAPNSPRLTALIVGMVLVALVGLWDDKTPIAPIWKLVALIPGAVVSGLLLPDAVPALLWPVFVLGFLFVANSVNLLDTLDGITGLMTALASLVYGFMASSAGLVDLAIACLALSGACIGFLFFNWRIVRPAAIFLGDMGSLALGAGLFIIAACLFHHATSPADHIAALLPIGLVMSNSLLTIYIRKRNGLKALCRSKDHISERLHRYGMPRWQVTVYLALVTLLSSIGGLVTWLASSPLIEAAGIALGVLVIGSLALYSTRLRLPSETVP